MPFDSLYQVLLLVASQPFCLSFLAFCFACCLLRFVWSFITSVRR